MKIFDGQRGKQLHEDEYITYTHKLCPVCKSTKDVSLFYKKKTKTARGWAWDSHCIDCRRKSCSSYAKATKDQRNARLRLWRKKNPAKAKISDRRKMLRRNYNLSQNDVDEMRERQSGKCAICDRKTSRLFIDHCHTTKKVRSLLCPTCNTFLGWYEKKVGTIIRFQKYLEAHKK